MQLQLPFFPPNTKLINATLGFREQDDMVHYLHNGNPIYIHAKDDHNGYRFILANLVVNHLCKTCELSKALGVGRKNIEHYVKAFKTHGYSYFFERKETRGQCYKMIPEKCSSIQSDLDAGVSPYHAAFNNGVSYGTVKYHLKNGNLKKNSNQKT